MVLNTAEYQQDITLNKPVVKVTRLSEKSVSRIVQQRKLLIDSETQFL